MTSNTFQADPHVWLDWCGPSEKDAIFESFLHHSPELNDRNSGKPDSYASSPVLSDTTPARERTRAEDAIVKVIEVKTDSDGVNVSYTGETVSLERAFQCGLIVASDYAKLLERQKPSRDAAENVSLFEPVHEIGPCEVNSLVSKCLGRKNSPISPRDARALRLSSPQLGAGDLNKDLDMEILNVDAAVQCDLRSSSSTLIVLGSQQQCLGLVLPPSEEIQTISELSEDDKLSAATEFTSSLFSKKEKIAAFYVPHFSEVVDFDVAIQKGLIDRHTAEVLKSIELPDVVPDIDRLNERFSSWLMYRKLTVDGCFHAAQCLKVDSTPSPTEAQQLFISYLVINSYVDVQTGKRVVILDRELSKMVKIFLEEPERSGEGNKHATSLELNALEQAGLNLRLHRNEDIDTDMEDKQHTCEPPYLVSSTNGRMSFRVEGQVVNHHPVPDVTEDNDMDMDETDPRASQKTRTYGSGSQTDDTDADGDSGESSHPAPRHISAESICSESDVADSFEAEFLRPDYLDDEQEFVIEVLEAHLEEEDILDVPSGVNAALIDMEAFVKLLDSNSDGAESTEGVAWDSMSDFKENASSGYNSSYSAYFLAEKQTISRSGCTVSVSESCHTDITENEFDDSDPEASASPPYAAESDYLDFTDASGTDKRPVVRKVVGREAAENTGTERAIADREVDCETTGNAEEMSRDLDRCPPAVDDGGSLWSQVTAECDHRTSKSSHGDSRCVSNSQPTGAAVVGENTQTSEERGSSASQTRHATFTAPPDSDSPLFIDKVLIAESDLEVEIKEHGESESDTPSHIPTHENNTEPEMSALESYLSSEPAPSRRYSSTRVERDVMSHSGKEDGTRMTSSPQSERFCVQREADQGFPESAISSDDIILPDRFEGITDGDSECEENHAAIRTSPEVELVDQDVSGSQYRSEDEEPSTGLSPDRQRGDVFRIGETRDGDVATGEMSSEQAEAAVRAQSGSETRADNNGTGEDASERAPSSQTDLPVVPSDCRVTSDAPSGASGVVTTRSDERDIRNYQSAEDVGSSHSFLPNTSQVIDKDGQKNSTPHALLESRHPDLLVDLLKRNAHNLESKAAGDQQQEGKVSKKAEEFTSIQQQLLQVLQTVTSSQDLSMLQEVMQSLNMALGSNTQEDQRHLLNSMKESSGGEDEGSAEDDSPQSSVSSDGRVTQTETKVQFKSVR